jgi:hypothetical protein
MYEGGKSSARAGERTVPENDESHGDNSIACTLRSCPTFDVRKYLYQLRQLLHPVHPIPITTLKALHAAGDYKGMVRLIKETMNVEVDIRVLWVSEGSANTGSVKDAPAWVTIPPEMPPYGGKAFREMRLDMYLRKSFLAQSAYDQIAIAVAHELSHIVLDSIEHRLRRCEKAVDLTAMLLGFRSLYGSGSNKESRSQQTVTIHQLGYLTSNEVQVADQVIREMQPSGVWAAFDRVRTYLSRIIRYPRFSVIRYPRFHVREEHLGLLILLGLCAGIGALILIANSFPEHVSHGPFANTSIDLPAQSTTGTVYRDKESTVSSAPPRVGLPKSKLA